ncbi:hypothetical protein Agub_g877, partial [Astrephomene gubernaculifera]
GSGSRPGGGGGDGGGKRQPGAGEGRSGGRGGPIRAFATSASPGAAASHRPILPSLLVRGSTSGGPAGVSTAAAAVHSTHDSCRMQYGGVRHSAAATRAVRCCALHGGNGISAGPGDTRDGGCTTAGTSAPVASRSLPAGVSVTTDGSATSSCSSGSGDDGGSTAVGSTTTTATTIITETVTAAGGGSRRSRRRTRDVRIVALDFDGTLLDRRSRILPSSVAAIRAAAAAGVTVVAATGKARPAALAAAAAAGLAEPGLLVWPEGPGVFLQGLAVHGRGGQVLSDAALPAPVVEAAFSYSSAHSLSLCAFLGDRCATTCMTTRLRELHTTYYEPLAEVFPSVSSLLAGPPVRKLLFMADPDLVSAQLLPYWRGVLRGGSSGAQVVQAVPNMLEIVPAGVNKWVGLQRLLGHLGLPASCLMAVGDGGNDLEMLAGAGLGVAMGNAVPEVRAAAAAVVAGHDEGGVAEAFERFVL